MTRAKRDELRRLLAEATPGPWGTWSVEDDEENFTHGVQGPTIKVDDGGMRTLNICETKQAGGDDEHDAALIAAMHSALPALLDALDAAEKTSYRKGTEDAAMICRAVYLKRKRLGSYPMDMGGIALECEKKIRSLGEDETP